MEITLDGSVDNNVDEVWDPDVASYFPGLWLDCDRFYSILATPRDNDIRMPTGQRTALEELVAV